MNTPLHTAAREFLSAFDYEMCAFDAHKFTRLCAKAEALRTALAQKPSDAVMLEREACADLCSEYEHPGQIANAIRARGEAQPQAPEPDSEADELTVAYMCGLHAGKKLAQPQAQPEPASPTLPIVFAAQQTVKDIEAFSGRSGPTIKLLGELTKINDQLNYAMANGTLVKPEPIAWRSAVLDLIDECPGLSMEQDHWLSRRVKELDAAVDDRYHFICLCPDCKKPAKAQPLFMQGYDAGLSDGKRCVEPVDANDDEMQAAFKKCWSKLDEKPAYEDFKDGFEWGWLARHAAPQPQAAEPTIAPPAVPACIHADQPKGCYRIRCQLGNKCIDDEMSPREPK